MAQLATFDILRILGFASIGASFTAIGTRVSKPVHLLKITNTTDADMLFSDDKINAKDIVPKNSFCLYDVSANRDGYNPADVLEFGEGTQYYVEYLTVPTIGSVYITIIYGS